MIDQMLNLLAVIAWFWFVLVVILLVLRGYQAGGMRSMLRVFLSWRIVIALVIALTLSLLSASLVFIEPQEVGVVISVLSPNGYREQPLRSGLHVVVPLAERVIRYPIYWQTYTMSTEPFEGSKQGADSISARTEDGQLVYLDSSVIYRIDANEAVRVHIDWQKRYVDDFIRPVMRGIIRTEVSQFTADEINSSKRKNLEENLGELLRNAFSDNGFVLSRFLLRNIAFSDQYANAIEMKQVAEQERLQREYQAEQMRKLAEGERDRLKIEADGHAAAIEIEAAAQATAIVLKAQAEQSALNLIREALAGDAQLLTYRYIEKIAPNLRVMLLPNNNPLLLPLPDMFNDQAGENELDQTVTLTPTPLLTPGAGVISPLVTLTATSTPAPTP